MSNDVHTLSGAYALDALSPEEADEFRRHLTDCAACREEVRELREAAARMGAAEAHAPRPELRDRILAAAGRTPQIPPPVAAPRSEGSENGTPRRRWPAWIAAAAAALLVVAGGALGIRAAVQDDQPQLSAAATRVFDAPDARTATVRTDNGGELVVGVSPGRGQMAVDARELPRLDSRHVYQLWAVHDGQMSSAAVLEDPEAGAAMDVPASGTQIALTVEPAGGSQQPTTQPLVEVDPQSV